MLFEERENNSFVIFHYTPYSQIQKRERERERVEGRRRGERGRVRAKGEIVSGKPRRSETEA